MLFEKIEEEEPPLTGLNSTRNIFHAYLLLILGEPEKANTIVFYVQLWLFLMDRFVFFLFVCCTPSFHILSGCRRTEREHALCKVGCHSATKKWSLLCKGVFLILSRQAPSPRPPNLLKKNLPNTTSHPIWLWHEFSHHLCVSFLSCALLIFCIVTTWTGTDWGVSAENLQPQQRHPTSGPLRRSTRIHNTTPWDFLCGYRGWSLEVPRTTICFTCLRHKRHEISEEGPWDETYYNWKCCSSGKTIHLPGKYSCHSRTRRRNVTYSRCPSTNKITP